MAMVGVASRRSSRIWILSGVFPSGTRRQAIFSSRPEAGKSRAVHSTLKAVCTTAMPTWSMGPPTKEKWTKALIT